MANRLVSTPPPFWPVAWISYFGRCVVNGNVISSEAVLSPPQLTHSLLVTIDGQQGTQFDATLTAVGNVFDGQTNLGQLLRTSTPTGPTTPFDSWVVFNAGG
jgi:hypothetical protein